MINIAICDDDKEIIMYIHELLLKFEIEFNCEFSIDTFQDGRGLVNKLAEGKQYDLLYLDIEMDDLNGIEAAKVLRNIDKTALLIYISSYDCYLKELFEVEPFRFMEKPLKKDIFYGYLKLAIERIRDNSDIFSFRFNKDTIQIPLKNVIYFESKGSIINIIEKNEYYKFYKKLDDVEKEIKENFEIPFLRIHKSYLINYLHIKRINYSQVEMSNGVTLKISEKQQKHVRQIYSDLLNIGGV